ncbi:ASCH domain protein [Ruminiclostridium hungatei]|uniref:ASCH domain protein n=1 Tax=Ruminiclostridium hungatei TaxID=48256 RepID=A0A1V4ST09_RUMHU|nr:ASCH domain-containing protein [Ruminiclostridium hungatei]OPX46377.1 ASCH domain protein [Ruminiclostridium hungatei]
MKAITIWQPWASLIACGAKKYETRSWPTKYRGPIAIHAAAQKPSSIRETIRYIIDKVRAELGIIELDDLPRGCIIATAELIGCYRVYDTLDNGLHIVKCPNTAYDFDKVEYIPRQEQSFGDWGEGRFAWELANVKMLPEPIPAKGQQGLWNWEGDSE